MLTVMSENILNTTSSGGNHGFELVSCFMSVCYLSAFCVNLTAPFSRRQTNWKAQHEDVLLFPEVELKGDNKRSGRNLDLEVTALDDESVAGGASCV